MPYKLYNIEGEVFDYNNRIINIEINYLGISIYRYREEVNFDIIDLLGHDLILGYLQLQNSNLIIN